MKKIFAAVTALCIMSSGLGSAVNYVNIPESISANAETVESDFEFDAETGTIIKYIGSATEVEIPSSINGVTVTEIGANAFFFCEEVTKVVVPDTVTTLGPFSFCGCKKLVEIDVPDSVQYIGTWAFVYCSKLKTINIPDGIKKIEDLTFMFCNALNSIELPDSLECIGEYSFYDCTGITEIKIPNSVTRIESHAFAGCEGYSELDLPDSITYIGEGAFIGNDGLKTINLPNSIKSIEDRTFYGCNGLTDVVIPESVERIGEAAFYYCDKIKEITIPDSVKIIENRAFASCYSLEKINFPKFLEYTERGAYTSTVWYEERVQKNELIFAGNVLINGIWVEGDIVIPEGVTSIGPNTFYHNDYIKSLTIPSTVENISDSALIGSRPMYEFIVSEDNKNYTTKDGVLYNKDMTELIQYPVAKNDTSFTIPETVTSISPYAFYGCVYLKDIIFPESVTNIGQNAFYGTEWMDAQFKENNGMLIINGILVKFRGYMDYHGEMISLNIPEGVTKIADYAFSNSDNISEVIMPDSLKYIGDYAFEQCLKLERVEMSDSVTHVGEGAFELCYALKEVKFSNKLEKIDDYAFYKCNKLEENTLPESLVSIGKQAFDGCRNLKIKTIPRSVKEIGKAAFKSCFSEEVTIPSTVEFIDDIALGFLYALNVTRGDYERKNKFEVYGVENTEAERYAKYYGFKFNAIEEDLTVTTTTTQSTTTTVVTTTSVVNEPEPTGVLFGDINFDGTVDASDASAVLTYYAKSSTGYDKSLEDYIKEEYPDIDPDLFIAARVYGKFGDINSDDVVDATDASAILTYYAKSSTGYSGDLKDFMESTYNE